MFSSSLPKELQGLGGRKVELSFSLRLLFKGSHGNTLGNNMAKIKGLGTLSLLTLDQISSTIVLYMITLLNSKVFDIFRGCLLPAASSRFNIASDLLYHLTGRRAFINQR